MGPRLFIATVMQGLSQAQDRSLDGNVTQLGSAKHNEGVAAIPETYTQENQIEQPQQPPGA